MKKYFLSIMSLFKNESHILDEWLEHYIKEGVEHFYLMNNNSTDNFHGIIEKYKDKITLYDRPKKHQQVANYNSIIPEIKKDTEWLLVCDLDEFVFATKNYKTIPDIIKKFIKEKKNITQIYLPWKMFSSNNHIEQPESVIHGFTDRKHYKEWNDRNKKYIILIDSLEKIDIHQCKMKNGISVDPKNKKPNLNGIRLNINEEELSEYSLHLNHHAIQSYNWFMSVKATRGSVNVRYNCRNQKYFDEYNKNTGYEDNLLKNKKY